MSACSRMQDTGGLRKGRGSLRRQGGVREEDEAQGMVAQRGAQTGEGIKEERGVEKEGKLKGKKGSLRGGRVLQTGGLGRGSTSGRGQGAGECADFARVWRGSELREGLELGEAWWRAW